jgi:hypothetical protein
MVRRKELIKFWKRTCDIVSVELNDWDTLLSRAEFAHNAAYHESIQSTPFKLNFGESPADSSG